MMPFLLAEIGPAAHEIPLYVCCVGSHNQRRIARKDGYPAHQLFLTRSGRGMFRIEGRPAIPAGPGSVLLLPAGVPHEYEAADPDEGWELGFAAFSGPAADAIAGQTAHLSAESRTAPNFERLWTELESVYEAVAAERPDAPWEASRRMYAMIAAFLEGQHDGGRQSERDYAAAQATRRASTALQTAVRLMHDHCGEHLKLSQIARAVGYSVQHLNRLFAAHYGMAPQQYWLQLRLRAAARLLKDDPGASIGAIADQVGMEPSYFIRMFKRTYGITPLQFRKR